MLEKQRPWGLVDLGSSSSEAGTGSTTIQWIAIILVSENRSLDLSRQWLQFQRDHYAKWDSLLQKILTIKPADMRKLQLDESEEPVFHDAFDERLYENTPPYHYSGYTEYTEYSYTIDLDREVFSVDYGAHFRLNCIPKNDDWIKAVFNDTFGNTFLLPQLVPRESIATLALGPPNFPLYTSYETLQARLVEPKSHNSDSPSHLTGPRLQWMLFNSFQKKQQKDLSVSLLGWEAQDLPFRELAYFIICLAAGGEHLSLVDKRRVKKPSEGHLYLGLSADGRAEDDMELATLLGVGYHMDGLPMGSAPKETKYWFETALICLVPQLDYPGKLEKAVADAIKYGRVHCTKNSFNALLISIEHIVLIKLLPDGRVDHTELLPLIFIKCHHSKDAQTRYGDQGIDALYHAIFSANVQDIKMIDTTHVEQLGQGLEQRDNTHVHCDDNENESKSEGQDRDQRSDGGNMNSDGAEAAAELRGLVDSENIENEKEQRKKEKERREKCIRTSFMALVRFFEATALEALRHTQPNEARLPEEICEIVLRNVTHVKTYNSCLRVSRRFRHMCQQRPLVLDNIAFLEPLPGHPTPSTIKDMSASHSPSPPDFLAVEMVSGRQMEVRLNSGGRDALTFFIVAGNEWNRKSFANFKVKFQGLCVSLPWTDKENKLDIRATR